MTGRGPGGLPASDVAEAVAHARPAFEAMRGASLFVTGGTGFFGRWLLAAVQWANAELGTRIRVTVLTRDPAGFARRLPDLAATAQVACGDVRTFEFPPGTFTHVIHAATDTSAQAHARPLELIDAIVAGTRRVLDFSVAAGVRRVLFVSSGAVYGRLSDEPVREDFAGAPPPGLPGSAYGQAKRLGEQLLTNFAERGLEGTVARAFAFVGPGLPLRAHFAIGNFVADAVAGSEIVVQGDGSPTRSYLYAADCAAWLLSVLACGTPGRAYNVGSDRAVTIAELAAAVAAAVPEARGVRVLGTGVPGERSCYVPSIARARSELGLDVWTGLGEAIARTAAYARAAG